MQFVEAAKKGTLGDQISSFVNHKAYTRLVASHGRARLQIETTPIMRGIVHPVRSMVVRPKMEEAFGFASAQILDFPTSMPASWQLRYRGSSI